MDSATVHMEPNKLWRSNSFLTYAFEEGVDGFCKDSIKIVVVHKVPL
jgi:hypothetical protein